MHYLFRFRDLVAPTVSEHEQIIRLNGWCWWGWWKRPSEDRRADIWDALASEVNARGAVDVGLFDSGSGEIYTARVTDVITPRDENVSEVAVPDGTENHIPTYYRESPFSRAWLKISKIDRVLASNFYGKYSYSSPPRVANYDAEVLSRFEGKVIADFDELRAMDTTIWEIRPQKLDDHVGEIVLTTNTLNRAVASKPIFCKTNLVVHISDLHFGVNDTRDAHAWRLEGHADSFARRAASLSQAIRRAIGKRAVGVIVATGDFTMKSLDEEFTEAARFLGRLLGDLDLPTDNLVILPGNHDVSFSSNHDGSIASVDDGLLRNYRRFYRNVFRHDPEASAAMGRRYVLPSGIVLELAAINSSAMTAAPEHFSGIGRIDEESLAYVARELGWHENAPSRAIRILALHHHLLPVEDLENPHDFGRGFGLAVDAVRIQRRAAELGVQLIMHGHKHRSFVWRTEAYPQPEDSEVRRLGTLNVLGAGSAGSVHTEGCRNYFNVLDFAPDKVNVELFVALDRSTEFTRHRSWSCDYGMDVDAARVTLSEWRT